MTQCWFIFAVMLIVVSARSAASSTSGTCASIGYSTRCCPRGSDCRATDGQAADGGCFCNSECHMYGDCCKDVHCPAQPMKCADVGITQCCDDSSGTGLCDVNFQDSDNNWTKCSCSISCHRRGNCCPDAEGFCIPKTCNDAGKYPTCCNSDRNDIEASACYVPGGRCYCDPLCDFFGDCCDDAPGNSSLCSFDGGSRLTKSKLQSFPNDKVLSRQRFYNRERRIHHQRVNTNYIYQEAPAARIQQVYMNEREFRSRPRVARQP